ncbi:MAG TPA: signal peptide peptidase SppA, partial [Nitrospirota bacterium]|nr:signal peptide peptidase SppA [Nitrospirota bacterium]
MRKTHPALVVLLTALILGMLFFAMLYAASLLTGKRTSHRMSPVIAGDKIALVKIEGLIAASEKIIEELGDYADDSSIKAIVIRVDSPGGGVVASQEIHNAVKKAKQSGKKVVVSMGSVAASGGYYLAAPADKIVANPGTLTGSIGVIMEFATIEKLLEKIGVKGMVIKAGEYKDMGSPFRDMTEQEKKLLQSVMDDVHAQFIQAVAEGRRLPLATVQAIADGRIFTGRQAMELKLVDQLGDL